MNRNYYNRDEISDRFDEIYDDDYRYSERSRGYRKPENDEWRHERAFMRDEWPVWDNRREEFQSRREWADEFDNGYDQPPGRYGNPNSQNGDIRDNWRDEIVWNGPPKWDDSRQPRPHHGYDAYSEEMNFRKQRNRERELYANDNQGASYIDKQEARGNRGYDNEDLYDDECIMDDRDGGFSSATSFHQYRDDERRPRGHRRH
jgi:hypothetical protein